MEMTNDSIDEYNDVVIVGAGPAGIGVGILLKKLGINYTLLERDSIGASFKQWPEETRFISPSFTGNFFRMPDLNAVTPDTSPAFDLLTEHPTGIEYAEYLERISKFFELEIETGVEVKSIEDKGGCFILDTSKGVYGSHYVIWAAGEYQYPKTNAFQGDHLCTHYSEIDSFSDIMGKESVVIGGFESGFDAAINLAKLGKKVTLIDSDNYVELINSDSSYSLSPFTRDRIKEVLDDIEYFAETKVEQVKFVDAKYYIKTDDDEIFVSDDEPVNCTGFDTSLKLVDGLFDFGEGYPLLTEFDESRKTKNLFLAGPQVKHGNALFCFIYKYRQRFAIVAEEIAKRSDIPPGVIENVLGEYKINNFYLKDLSCCDDECVC
ncbi:MAG: NAD(P)-binding domain-containing protein [Mameliella sp.]|nr:NAD(P)-binding domain-containing protein [Phaeodactylibacter sp.]NRA49273.1 NAD(P)-binding domain-containing protein [Phaeodactylibacter sp.]